MKRYVFIGSIKYSAYCLKVLLKMGINMVTIMCPDKNAAKFNSDYCDLGKVAGDFGKGVYYFKKISAEAGYIRAKNPDIIFVLGLSQIILKEILSIPTIGCIGSHPALLPQNRGRHPIIWAIANGLTKSGISLFWMDEGIDSGDIWAQKTFDIKLSDNAHTVYRKVERLSGEILKENIPDLENGIIKRIKQGAIRANYWRKRTEQDGEIDWRMPSKRIYDLVRALSKPYVGAHYKYKGRKYKIWKVRMIKNNGRYSRFEPGKVVSIGNLRIGIKSGDGVVEIVEHKIRPLLKIGDYL